MIRPNFELPSEVMTLILKYYPKGSIAFYYYYTHCVKVTELALKIASLKPQLQLNKEYLINAGMLHDIGIIKTNAPDIGCFGDFPYISHTFLGRIILEENGFETVAPVCERHLGVGLTKKDIISSKFPLPHRDMIPTSNEEKLICYADKFYSKSDKHLTIPKSLDKIRKKVKKYGRSKSAKFEEFIDLFGNPFD